MAAMCAASGTSQSRAPDQTWMSQGTPRTSSVRLQHLLQQSESNLAAERIAPSLDEMTMEYSWSDDLPIELLHLVYAKVDRKSVV